jgi:hypothetical protein
MKLSNQAVGSIMLALQKGILEQTDITGLLKGFEFEVQQQQKFVFAQDDEPVVEELFVKNPPTLEYQPEEEN